jgi:outer membrane protein
MGNIMPSGIKRLTVLGACLAVATALATPAMAAEAGDWLVRARAIGVVPTSESDGITPDLTTGKLQAQPAVVPELDFTYMATENIGFELILATTEHDVKGRGSIAGLGKVADTWLLPPTLLVQWHFLPKSRFNPYIGAGINYTITYGEDASQSLESALGGPTKVSLDNSLGWAVQAGMDIGIDDHWFVNVDVKYIDMSMDARIKSGGVTRKDDVDINPIIAGVGIGYRF